MQTLRPTFKQVKRINFAGIALYPMVNEDNGEMT